MTVRNPVTVLREASSWFSGGVSSADLRLLAGFLLTDTQLVVSGTPVRLCEIEFYCHSASHPDPFTHRHEIQRQCGAWYFHRVGSGYKGGSFKGLDLTFGMGDVCGGVLIRSLETNDGQLIDGPSLCVDFLLQTTGHQSVRELDAACQGPVWDPGNPIRLESTPETASEPETATTAQHSSRVGLSLRQIPAERQPEKFLLRRYRFLTEPRRIRKGRPNLILALLHDGVTAGEIAELTGSPRRTIARYAQQVEQGAKKRLDDLRQVKTSAKEHCWLEGLLPHK